MSNLSRKKLKITVKGVHMKPLKIIFFISILFLSDITFAQEKWNFNGQIRHRFEMDNKDFSGDTKLNNFNILRSRFGIKYQNNNNLSAFLQVQDSRTFGEESSTLSDGSADNLDLHQGFFDIKNVFELPVDIRVGRFEAIYGGQRLIGAVGWHNIGRSFDGFILKLKTKKGHIDFFSFDEVENEKKGDLDDQNIFGAYGNFGISKSINFQPYLIWQQNNKTKVLNRQTVGFYYKGKVSDINYEGEFAYQIGTRNDLDVGALLAAVNLGYTFSSSSVKPGLGIGLDYLSGDDDPSDNKYKVFDTMYATNHKFYGFMDYFLNIPSHTNSAGLTDLHAKGFLNPFNKAQLSAVFHILNTSEDYMISGKNQKSLGKELDVTFKYNYDTNITFTGGLSFFFPGEIFKVTKGEDISTWIYLMTVVSLN